MVSKPEKPDRRTVQLPIDWHHRIKLEAARRDVSMGELVCVAFDRLVAAEAAARKPGRAPRRRAASA